MFENDPCQNPRTPSFFQVFFMQSQVPSYIFSALMLCIIILRLMVSPGYEIVSEKMTVA